MNEPVVSHSPDCNDISLPEWVKKFPDFEAESFRSNLATILKLEGDLPGFESRYKLLEKFENVRTELLRTADTESVSADSLYDRLSMQYGTVASYGAIYQRLHDNGYINLNSISTALDLGTGYWISSIAYQAIFPSLQFIDGVELDRAKIATYKSSAQRLFELDPSKFRIIEGDLFEAVKGANQQEPSLKETYDLVLLQSYFPATGRSGSLYFYGQGDPKSSEDYDQLLVNIPRRLNPNGVGIVMIDAKDIPETPTLQYFDTKLRENAKNVVSDSRIGIDPSWGVAVSVDVNVYILGSSNQPH